MDLRQHLIGLENPWLYKSGHQNNVQEVVTWPEILCTLKQFKEQLLKKIFEKSQDIVKSQDEMFFWIPTGITTKASVLQASLTSSNNDQHPDSHYWDLNETTNEITHRLPIWSVNWMI